MITWRRSDDLRLVVGRAAADIDRKPNISKLKECRLALAQYRGAEDVTIECDRTLYISDNRTIRVFVTTKFSSSAP
jgi:hypothetical protein